MIKFYALTISGFLRSNFGTGCRFSPSCSQYALECFERFGFLEALSKSIKRISKCHPLSEGGYDPVVTHVKHDVQINHVTQSS